MPIFQLILLSPEYCTPLALLLLRLFKHLLHNLLLLNQKRPHYSILDTVRTSRSAIGALNCFLGLGNRGVLTRSEGWDLRERTRWFSKVFGIVAMAYWKETVDTVAYGHLKLNSLEESVRGRTHPREFDSTITAFRGAASLLKMLVLKFSAWGFYDADFVGACVVATGIEDCCQQKSKICLLYTSRRVEL